MGVVEQITELIGVAMIRSPDSPSGWIKLQKKRGTTVSIMAVVDAYLAIVMWRLKQR